MIDARLTPLREVGTWRSLPWPHRPPRSRPPRQPHPPHHHARGTAAKCYRTIRKSCGCGRYTGRVATTVRKRARNAQQNSAPRDRGGAVHQSLGLAVSGWAWAARHASRAGLQTHAHGGRPRLVHASYGVPPLTCARRAALSGTRMLQTWRGARTERLSRRGETWTQGPSAGFASSAEPKAIRPPGECDGASAATRSSGDDGDGARADSGGRAYAGGAGRDDGLPLLAGRFGARSGLGRAPISASFVALRTFEKEGPSTGLAPLLALPPVPLARLGR